MIPKTFEIAISILFELNEFIGEWVDDRSPQYDRVNPLELVPMQGYFSKLFKVLIMSITRQHLGCVFNVDHIDVHK